MTNQITLKEALEICREHAALTIDDEAWICIGNDVLGRLRYTDKGPLWEFTLQAEIGDTPLDELTRCIAKGSSEKMLFRTLGALALYTTTTTQETN